MTLDNGHLAKLLSAHGTFRKTSAHIDTRRTGSWYLGGGMPRADQQSPAIHYEIVGLDDAPPLVMLRGLGRSLRHWEGVQHELLPHFRLVLIDNRGVGNSEAVRRPFSTGAMADDVAHVLAHAGVARTHLFGMSLGGMIAQQFALRHPDLLDRLVLGCTTPGSRHAPRAPLSRFLSVARARFGSVEEAVTLEAKLVLSETYRRAHPSVIKRWIALAERQPVAPLTMLLQALAGRTHDVNSELSRIRSPTLIIATDTDRLIPAECARMLARGIPNSELTWLRGAGHDFATERSAETASLLKSFLLDHC